MANNETFLRTVSIFSTLSDEERALLAPMFKEAQYSAGDRVVREGEPSNCLFLVKKGFVNVVRQSYGKQDTLLTTLIAGDYFGEASLFENIRRTASVVAAEDTTLLEITREPFEKFLQANPLAANRVLSEMLKQVLVRLAATSRNLQDERTTAKGANTPQAAVNKLFV